MTSQGTKWALAAGKEGQDFQKYQMCPRSAGEGDEGRHEGGFEGEQLSA